MYDRLEHPAMLTLTVPNLPTIRKHDFSLFRNRVRQLIKQHSAWIKGGVYSLETTYNRTAKTWHIHAHVLIDAATPLPTKKDKIDLAGQRVFAFTAIKLRLEYDWLRLWGTQWGKAPRKDAKKTAREGETYKFEQWVRVGREMRLKEYRDGKYQPIQGISAADMQRRTEWNAANRRVVDVRTVIDRDGAAREVLKYITKVAAFSDIAEAVEPFCNAVRGARLIQTFGSWYGVKLNEAANGEHPEDWGDLTCFCGMNTWLRMGVFYHRDVQMDAEGRWRLRRPHDHKSRGTVPRPTIRALDERVGDYDDVNPSYEPCGPCETR